MDTFPEQNPEQNELSSQAGQAKSAANEPTTRKIRGWDKNKLLLWIQQKLSVPLEPTDAEKFLNAGIDGTVFFGGADDKKFFQDAGFSFGASVELAELARETRDSEQASLEESSDTASKKRRSASRKEASQSPNQKRLRLSNLPGSDAIYETESAENRSHPFFPGNAEFSNFFNEPSAIVVDKTHFIPILEKGPFYYMFLRPRRWGKSTFLNMLAAYYDVKTKDSFKDIFGELYIGKAPTKSRNSHLILLFNFSTITTIGSPQDIKQAVFDNISRSLRRFLFRYRDILGDVLPEEYIIPGCTATSLTNVLDLIYHSGYTAFVGVDEYDAPTNPCLMTALSDRNRLSEKTEVIDCLEELIKSEFLGVIKECCGKSVAKYWLTGVLPTFRDWVSPLTATELISSDEQYQSLCGLTQEDVNAIVIRALPESERTSTLDSLKRWYNGYKFSPTLPDSENLLVYNPQQVFVHLRKELFRARRRCLMSMRLMPYILRQCCQ